MQPRDHGTAVGDLAAHLPQQLRGTPIAHALNFTSFSTAISYARAQPLSLPSPLASQWLSRCISDMPAFWACSPRRQPHCSYAHLQLECRFLAPAPVRSRASLDIQTHHQAPSGAQQSPAIPADLSQHPSGTLWLTPPASAQVRLIPLHLPAELPAWPIVPQCQPQSTPWHHPASSRCHSHGAPHPVPPPVPTPNPNTVPGPLQSRHCRSMHSQQQRLRHAVPIPSTELSPD